MKGVSEILGAALLLGIAVTVAGIYGAFASDLAERAGSEISQDTDADIKCRNAAINIRNTLYNDSEDTTSMEIVNSGTVNLQNITVYTVKSSQIQSSEEYPFLDVEDALMVTLKSTSKPDLVAANSAGCPDVSVRRPL